jgi:F-box and leucine-rich repeat protein GRR1
MNDNGTDDTEYEDDYDEQFNEDGTPEPDIEVADGDRPPPITSAPPGNATVQHGGRTRPSQPQAHEFMFNRGRSPRAVTIPTFTVGAGRQGNSVSPSVNILGATSRLNAQIQDGTAIPVAGPSRRGRQNVEGNQMITDMLPIIETPSSSSHGQNMHTQEPMEPIYCIEDAHTQPAGMDLETPVVLGVNPVDMNTQAGPSSGVYPRAEGNQWNMRRTLRDVFHFGRNPQEIPQSSPTHPSGNNPTRS